MMPGKNPVVLTGCDPRLTLALIVVGPSFGVSFGSFGAGLVSGPTLLDWAEQAERLGFDALWFRDHILWHSPVLDPFTMLGAIAARTSRLRLGPGVLLLPLRHPTLVAKAIATLDVVSDGRAMLGVGVGGEFPKEYEACGVPLAERGRRADEALEVIRALWTGSPARHSGAFFSLDGAVMQPRPVQKPHPPIWVGGRSDAALRRAARAGDGWLAYFATPARFRESLDKIAAHREGALRGGEAGAPWAGASRTFGAGLILYVCLAASREEARAAAAAYLTNEYRQPFASLVDRYCALGSPADCAETIQRFVEAGVDHVVLIPTVAPDRVPEQLARLAEDALPALGGARA
jgi:probable F420-dependent oxidoreductase